MCLYKNNSPTVQSGPVRSGLARSGPVRSGPVWPGLVRPGLVWSGPVWSGPVRSGPVRSGLARSGPVRPGLVRSGPVWSGPFMFFLISYQLYWQYLMWRVLESENLEQTESVLAFIHSVFCLTRGPKPPPKPFLHIVRSRASSFKWEYPVLSLSSSSSFLRLLPRPLDTSISPFIFLSITCFRRQFLRKMCPIQLAFRL